LGVIFFMHGSQKVLGWFGGGGLVETVKGFTGMGMPAVVAYLVCFGEFLGGIGLIVGCLSRVAALGILIIMIGAVATVHWKNGFFLQNQGYEYNLALIALALGVILGGPGCCAFDNLFCRKKEGMVA
jgi:putative oxidoreductase